jgi:hypothetical protein
MSTSKALRNTCRENSARYARLALVLSWRFPIEQPRSQLDRKPGQRKTSQSGKLFDRLLVAQAIVENMPIVSSDAALDAYGVQRLW